MGETVVLIAGGVDLSIGGTMALSGVVVIMLMNAGVPIPVAIALTLLVGVAVGAVNAFISVYQRAEPFIITLGMGIVLTGAAQQLTNARSVSSKLPDFQLIANTKILGPVPILVVVMLAVLAVTYWMLRSTSFGRNVYAVGGDYEVAKYSGINVRRTKAATYLICGLTAALGGVMLASQLNSASSLAGENTALYVVCAVVVGGTSVAGGVGGAIKSAIGLVLLGLLTNAFNLLQDRLAGVVPAHRPAGHHHRVDPVARQLRAEATPGSHLTIGQRRAVDGARALEAVTCVHLSATRRGRQREFPR